MKRLDWLSSYAFWKFKFFISKKAREEPQSMQVFPCNCEGQVGILLSKNASLVKKTNAKIKMEMSPEICQTIKMALCNSVLDFRA